MSQCYHAELKESVSRVVRGEDSVSYPIELTEILPQDEMVDLLRDQLKSADWVAKDDSEMIFVTEGSAGEILTIDLNEMELSATVESEREVVAEATVKKSADSHLQARNLARNELKEEVAALGDQIEDEGTSDLQKELTAQLVNSEAERQRAMHELLQQVYAESLKRKAAQLGDVMEISESTNEDGNYELTIRIEQ